MFTTSQQHVLLRLARQSIEHALTTGQLPASPDTVEEAFRAKLGAFVTLTREGALRGCIGFPEPVFPLHEAITRGAISAAFQDPRFPPVAEHELPMLHIEISVLSPLAPITPEEIVIGTHGLVIERGGARGLLLPQVPVEWGWDRETYLQHLCRKAGLRHDAWQQGARLFGFTAHVFSEE